MAHSFLHIKYLGTCRQSRFCEDTSGAPQPSHATFSKLSRTPGTAGVQAGNGMSSAALFANTSSTSHVPAKPSAAACGKADAPQSGAVTARQRRGLRLCTCPPQQAHCQHSFLWSSQLEKETEQKHKGNAQVHSPVSDDNGGKNKPPNK